MTKTQRFETIKQKLELMEDLWVEIQDLKPESLSKKQKDELYEVGMQFTFDMDSFFMDNGFDQ